MIRLTVGRYAGELRDVEPEAATAMLRDGRAELAFADQLPAREVSAPVVEIGGESVSLPAKAVMGAEFVRGAKRKAAK